MNLFAIFTSGLLAGGLTCLAVQGGLLASSITYQKGTSVPIISFLASRLVAYTVLGAFLGMFGSVFQFSLVTVVILQVAVAIFMIATALNLLEVHPFFRYFVLQPPHALTKHLKRHSRSSSFFGPVLLGSFTIFIPCGATQAMMAYAMTTGSAASGALTMAVFILGTSPVFFLFGYGYKKVGLSAGDTLKKVAAVVLIAAALYILYTAAIMTGLTGGINTSDKNGSGGNVRGAGAQTPVDRAVIYFTPSAYVTEPATIAVQAGSRVRLTLVNTEGIGCIQAFTIPSLGVQRAVPVGRTEDIVITVPDKPGDLPFMCAMGMYRGVIKIL